MNSQYNDEMRGIIIIPQKFKMYTKVKVVGVNYSDNISSIIIPYQSNAFKGSINLRLYKDLKSKIHIRHKNDLNCSLNIRLKGSNDFLGTISICPKTSMFVKVKILAIQKNEIDGNIIIPHSNVLNSTIKLRINNNLKSQLWIRHENSFNSNIKVRLTENNNLLSSIAVQPHNRMFGKVTIVEPPKVKMQIPIVKDAFVRSQVQTLNYGNTKDLLVGVSDKNEVYKSYLNFNVKAIPKDIKIISAKLILSCWNLNSFSNLDIYEVDSYWDELGITYASQPNSHTKINNINVSNNQTKLEIDVTDTINKWYAKPYTNYGFVLKPQDETIQQVKELYSKEYGLGLAPVIEVEYYDTSNIFSSDRADLSSDITVIGHDKSDFKGVINVKQWYNNLDFNGWINVKDSSMLSSSILVIRRYLNSSIWVREKTDLNSSIEINKIFLPYDFNGSIFVSKCIMDSSINVRQHSSLSASLLVNKEYLFSSIEVPHRINFNGSIEIRKINNFAGTITVQRQENNDEKGNIIVRRKEICDIFKGNIKTRLNNNLKSDIIVSRKEFKNVNSYITIRRKDYNDLVSGIILRFNNDLRCSLVVVQKQFRSLKSKITIRRKDNNDLNASINVNPYTQFNGCILIRRNDKSNINCNIKIRRKDYADKITANMILRLQSNLKSNITVRQTSNKELNVGIVIRRTESSEISSTINVNPYYDFPCEIRITSCMLNSHITIRRKGEDSLQGNIRTRLQFNLNSKISVAVTRNEDFKGNICVRRTDYTDFNGNIIIARACRQLNSTIDIRQIKNLNASIRIIGVWFSDINSSIRVKKGNSTGKRRAYAFIM